MAIADLSSATYFEIWLLNNCENNKWAKEYRNYNMVKKNGACKLCDRFIENGTRRVP